MMKATGMLGNRAEKLALNYLRRQKLKKIECNYHCRYGEIDIIMRDNYSGGNSLVFVEVRYRRNDDFGGALASVDRHKQAKLRRSAQSYLQAHNLSDSPCRFDILCLAGDLKKPEFNWIKNAF